MSDKSKVLLSKKEKLLLLRDELLERRKELLDVLERMKEIQRMEFDYFKHLTTLSTGVILIIVAFIEKVFTKPQMIPVAMISIFCFLVCVVGSLLALPLAGNIVLYSTGIRTVAVSIRGEEDEGVWEKAKKKALEGLDKICNALDSLGCYDKITRWFFIAGIVIFLIFTGINIL